jgi:hypothetical protein
MKIRAASLVMLTGVVALLGCVATVADDGNVGQVEQAVDETGNTCPASGGICPTYENDYTWDPYHLLTKGGSICGGPCCTMWSNSMAGTLRVCPAPATRYACCVQN